MAHQAPKLERDLAELFDRDFRQPTCFPASRAGELLGGKASASAMTMNSGRVGDTCESALFHGGHRELARRVHEVGGVALPLDGPGKPERGDEQ